MKHAFAVAAILVVVASPALAAPEDVAADVSSQIMSPFCPGVTLHDCPSAEADELRLQIATWAGAGWSKDRIMDRLVAEYGRDIRALPPAGGRGLAAWLLPVAAGLSGIAAAWLLIRRWTSGLGGAEGAVPPGSPPSTVPSASQARRLEAELDVLRGEL